jgi:extracellular factor (EF) 3-hydroxypalmitic acid methyl ester biosynthesis protein
MQAQEQKELRMQHALDFVLPFLSRQSPSHASGQIDLNDLADKIEVGDTQAGVASLVGELSKLRFATNTDEWHRFIAEEARLHPIKDLLHRDSFTRHAYSKPRGYPGDAELLDYIYEPQSMEISDSVGKRIAAYTTNAAAPRAARQRRDIIAELIDFVANEKRRNPRILSLACGDLREAGMSHALKTGRSPN